MVIDLSGLRDRMNLRELFQGSFLGQGHHKFEKLAIAVLKQYLLYDEFLGIGRSRDVYDLKLHHLGNGRSFGDPLRTQG